MGRHALPDPGAAGSDHILGWGSFASTLGAALAGWSGDGWDCAVAVAGLGGGATAALWIAVQVTQRNLHTEATLTPRPAERRGGTTTRAARDGPVPPGDTPGPVPGPRRGGPSRRWAAADVGSVVLVDPDGARERGAVLPGA